MGRIAVRLAALAAMFAPAAIGCINDRDVVKAEREFKSDYERPAPTLEADPELDLTSVGLTALGAAMLCGAVVRVRRNPPPLRE